MSYEFAPMKKIKWNDLFDGRLCKYGVHEHVSRGTNPRMRCLRDGEENYVWVMLRKASDLLTFIRYGHNDFGIIFGAILEEFNTDIVHEHHEDFLNNATMKELEFRHSDIERYRNYDQDDDLIPETP